MSTKYSTQLRAEDLNDFDAPKSCYLPPNGSKKSSSNPHQTKDSKANNLLQTEERIQIAPKDCLACSGCVQSVEMVRLKKESLDEFLSNINKGKAVIVSLSPQSRASLAVHFGISSLQVFGKLTTFLKNLGVKAVFDTSCGKDLTLIESCNQFILRYKQNQSTDDERCKSALPMISSACPGWICEAEKNLGSYILPYISSVKSPQQTIGAVLKRHICQKMGLSPDKVYHVTVMPCYDKKVEASRHDFVFQVESQGVTHDNEGLKITEVDLVLTSGEVLDLIQLKAVDIKSIDESPLDRIFTHVNEEGHLYGVHGSSGGYAETIYRHAAKTLFGKEILGRVDFKTIGKSDLQEVTLQVEGKTVLKFALCYGSKNLKKTVQEIKLGKCDYHFLEIMQCPLGCLNGDGQTKPKQGQSAGGLVQFLEALYMENVLVADPFDNPLVRSLYDKWLEQPGSEKAKRYMHTEYHPVVKSITAQLLDW